MPSWVATTLGGRWQSNSGAWVELNPRIQSNGYTAGWRFETVDIPQGVTILSATLTTSRYQFTSNSGTVRLGAVISDDAPPFADGERDQPLAGPSDMYVAGDPVDFDFTAAIQAVVDREGWRAGNAIGLIGRWVSGNTLQFERSATLTVEWQESVQYLDPVTVQVPAAAGGPMEVSFSVTPATVHVSAVVGRVDVIAPRTLRVAATITAPAATGVAGISGTGHAPPLDVADTLHLPVRVGVALLSLTIPPAPPPTPWRTLVASPEYRAALDTRQPVTDARLEVINPDGAVIATLGGPDATHPGVVSGSVSCRGDTPIRWEHDLAIDNPELVPRDPYDLLSPFSYNRLRVWWRIRLPDGTWGEVPVGTTFVDWPTVDDNGDAAVGVRVRCSDAVAEVKRARYRQPLDIADLPGHEAIARILASQAPWATHALTPTDYRLPPDYQVEPGADPVDDIIEIAKAAGMEFYADRMGTLVLAPAPDAGAAPVESFIEGPGCAMTGLTVGVDMSRVLNSITLESTATKDAQGRDIEPVIAHATDDDPTSPTWIHRPGGHIYHETFRTSEALTQEQADQEARRILNDALAVVDEVELVHFARPHLDPGQVVEVERQRAAVSGARQVVNWTLALGDLSGQRTSTTGRRGLT